MNRKIYIITGILFYVLLQSCSSDYEDVPVEQFTEDFVFSRTDSIGEKAQQFLTSIYASALSNGHNRLNGDYLDAATDDAISSALSITDVENLATGNYTSMERIDSDMKWGDYYAVFRKVNTFVNNIDKVPLKMKFNDGQPMTRAWKAEARFLRAYTYFNLLKRYGGVPIVPEYNLGLEDAIEFPRSSFEEGVNYIVTELDAIKDSLRIRPIENSADAHVATKGTALALKSRVLLYAASPLFNGGNIDATNPLTGYTDYEASRWKKAADAAQEFMNQLPYYQLNSSYITIFTDANPEIIFFRDQGRGKSIETTNGPIGYGSPNDGDGRTSPSQNLVEAFPMADGKTINDPTSAYTYNPNNQYIHRDPRLDFTVLHNNSLWLNKDVETFEGGKDNPTSGIQKTKTSYYMRKFMGAFENSDNYDDHRRDWIIFRYAEILLNYAEAENEYSGPTTEVYQAIKNLRERAGIEAGTDGMYGLKPNMTKDEMRTTVHNERRIEMAFEEQRYWDIRRWKIAEDVYSKPVNGLTIVRTGGTFSYNLVPVLNPSFEEKQYLYPIPYSEVVKNDNMQQNPGW
ncbi:RagB/SusD family nutrient uptake outer membrane protein [Zhouia sp. PK063]|uniref:RagB/SusD family nutrient uptake outer membrane protein n=1 Tax=Zhouia sp. PK063 TaxID=3373602 RepID=UPI0037AECB2C